jgi:NADH-quinone oxidoreductase subunit H
MNWDTLREPVLFVVRLGVPIAVFMGVFLVLAWAERKLLGRVQNRRGPNRAGPAGILQPIADGIKLLTKEDVIPFASDKVVHTLAPILAVIPALLVSAVVPLWPGFVPVDLNIGVLFAFAVSTASVLALFMAGWASRNKFSLLGAMRAVAQVISYEVPMVLAAVVVLMAVGSLSTTKIVEAQQGLLGWFVFQPWGFVGFVIFTMGAMAESARTPFDIPEAESEIVAGYHTEYSGFKFALFQMGEYLASIVMAAVGVTLFLGGPNGPGSGPGLVGSVLGLGWFLAKLWAMILINVWARGTWPRLRVDQLLAFAWKVMLPMALVNIVAMAVWHFAPVKAVGWIGSAALLVAAWVTLTKFSARGVVEKRTYRYADLP